MIRMIQAVITTGAATGAGSASVGLFAGELVMIRYVKTDYTDGVDFAITESESGVTLWTETNVNASKTVMPRGATDTTAGVAAVFGTDAVLEKIPVVGYVDIAVTSGGNSHSGTFYVYVEE